MLPRPCRSCTLDLSVVLVPLTLCVLARVLGSLSQFQSSSDSTRVRVTCPPSKGWGWGWGGDWGCRRWLEWLAPVIVMSSKLVWAPGPAFVVDVGVELLCLRFCCCSATAVEEMDMGLAVVVMFV